MASHSSQHPLFTPFDDPYPQSYRSQPPPEPSPSPQPFRALPLEDTPSSARRAPEHCEPYSSYSYTASPGHRYPRYPDPQARGEAQARQGGTAPDLRVSSPQQHRWTLFWKTYRTTHLALLPPSARNRRDTPVIRLVAFLQLSFLATVGIQAAVVLTLIGLVYGTIHSNIGDLRASELFEQDPKLETVATYLSLFILAVVFEVLVTMDAMQQKNIIGLVVLVLFQICMLVYSAVLPRQLHNALVGSNADTPHVRMLVRAYAITIPCVVGACTVAMAVLDWKLYEEFGWDVFKRIGADIQLKRMYLLYQIFVCLLKFDAFFFVGFEIQFLVLVTGTPTAEFVLTIVALPIILVALALTAVVVRVESRTGVYVSFICQVAGMAYFIWKLARIYLSSSSERYTAATATLTIFSVISLVMLLATFVLTGLCMSNFGKGLKEKIPGYAFNGGRAFRPTLASTSGRLSFSHAPLSPGAVDGKFEKYPSMAVAHQTSYGAGAERTSTRMSID
ncbi:hypothetical protein JCM21900_001219 [Sporobolomyces salmonicolor]